MEDKICHKSGLLWLDNSMELVITQDYQMKNGEYMEEQRLQLHALSITNQHLFSTL